MEQKLLELTEDLLQKTNQIKSIFAEVKKANQERDFYQEVKPFANEVKARLDQWGPLAIDWLKANPVKYLHPQQITHTAENLDMISIQCFFPKTSLTRFRHYAESVEYVLKNLLLAMQDKKD